MVILAPVRAANSGACRCSGSAICGPVKVSTVTSTPANWPVPPPVVAAAGVLVAPAGAAVLAATGGMGVAVGEPESAPQPATSGTSISSPTRFRNLAFIASPPSKKHQILDTVAAPGRPSASAGRQSVYCIQYTITNKYHTIKSQPSQVGLARQLANVRNVRSGGLRCRDNPSTLADQGVAD